MKKRITILALCFMCISLAACGEKSEKPNTPQPVSNTVTENVQSSKPTEAAKPDKTENKSKEQNETTSEAAQNDKTDNISEEQSESVSEAAQPDNTPTEQSEPTPEALTEDQALAAIKNYCSIKNPNLNDLSDQAKNASYWNVMTNESNEIVVLYRSYTAAQTRYYIDPVSGNTYVTEFVPGIIDEEQRTDESLNVRDYLS